MNGQGLLSKITSFYIGAFRRSVATRTGRRLWFVLAIKIAILLIGFKLLFFPDRLASYETDADKAEAVRNSLITNPHVQ